MKKRIINLILTFIIGAIIYYFSLPAFNLNNIGFYIYVGTILIVYGILDTMSFATNPIVIKKGRVSATAEPTKAFAFILGLITMVGIVLMFINFICSPLFNAKSYQTRITVDETGNFTEDIEEVMDILFDTLSIKYHHLKQFLNYKYLDYWDHFVLLKLHISQRLQTLILPGTLLLI